MANFIKVCQIALFQAGGNPEEVIELLSKNYVAVAQMANLMAEWLILAGAEINDVQQQVSKCSKISKCRPVNTV